jgi:hypothetical protein
VIIAILCVLGIGFAIVSAKRRRQAWEQFTGQRRDDGDRTADLL